MQAPAAPVAGPDSKGQRINPLALQANMRTLMVIKAIMTVAGAVITGTLGLTGWTGFGMYVLVQLASVLTAAAKAGGDIAKFLPGSIPSLWASSLLEQLVTFIMFWTLAFAVVHIYN